jgi:ParB/RepB/Spo0J family partition protein
MTNFCEIPLDKICPNPKNPRKHFEGRKLDDLTASVKQKGVIEPIIVRPSELRTKAKGKVKDALVEYEIVAGDRRYRASVKAGLATIPAIIRELTDDEAYDFMLVENLQREDLTEREEAESFKAYITLHSPTKFQEDVIGEDIITALAEKTGISPAYIRARVRILELPARVLKAWEEGKLCFGHLHQLLRAQGDSRLEETVKWLFGSARWGDGATIDGLRRHIDDEAPALSGAFFKVRDVCAACPSNSTVQKQLFDVETSKGVHCLNPACFKKHQGEWLTANWKTTAIAKATGTNGFRFQEDSRRAELNDFDEWSGSTRKPGLKCKNCSDFVSEIDLAGRVIDKRSCAGKKSCYDAVTNPKSAKEKATGERDPEAPRASWHGEFFRDVFFTKRIPEILAGVDPEDPKIKALLLVCAVHGNRFIVEMPGANSAGLLAKPAAELRKVFKSVVEKVVLSGPHVGDTEYNGFGTAARRRVGEYLGIDLAKEFAVDADYLDKKTKAEILAFGKKFKLFDKNVDTAKLKKSDLAKVVLSHGDKLVGKVPVEILKA